MQVTRAGCLSAQARVTLRPHRVCSFDDEEMPGIRRLANESDRLTTVQARLRRMLNSGRCADRSASEVSNLARVPQRHRVEFESRCSALRTHRPEYGR